MAFLAALGLRVFYFYLASVAVILLVLHGADVYD